MKRPNHEIIKMFTGKEVEHTAMYQQDTLFVVGIQPVDEIIDTARKHNLSHIYFGANHSYTPKSTVDHNNWDNMIHACLKQDFWCTLDLDVTYIQEFLDSAFTEYRRFIPMISVKIPYVLQLGYNAVIKIDDIDFDRSNPGVWCHKLHTLLDQDKFTSWDAYKNDTEVK